MRSDQILELAHRLESARVEAASASASERVTLTKQLEQLEMVVESTKRDIARAYWA